MPNHKLLIAAILFPLNMFIMVFYALLLSEKYFCNKKIHRLLLNSYLISGGWSNSLIAYLLSKRSEILTGFNNPTANSCLFEPKTHPDFEKKFKELNEDGYVIFELFAVISLACCVVIPTFELFAVILFACVVVRIDIRRW